MTDGRDVVGAAGNGFFVGHLVGEFDVVDSKWPGVVP